MKDKPETHKKPLARYLIWTALFSLLVPVIAVGLTVVIWMEWRPLSRWLPAGLLLLFLLTFLAGFITVARLKEEHFTAGSKGEYYAAGFRVFGLVGMILSAVLFLFLMFILGFIRWGVPRNG